MLRAAEMPALRVHVADVLFGSCCAFREKACRMRHWDCGDFFRKLAGFSAALRDKNEKTLAFVAGFLW